jgi:hypothetical protein
MEIAERTEEDAFNLQIGLGRAQISEIDKHFFDISGFLLLENLLDSSEVRDAQRLITQVESDDLSGPVARVNSSHGREFLNAVELGGSIERSMALRPVLAYVENFIWGRQFRLVGSRAIIRESPLDDDLNQGGTADRRRYARYRCAGNGEFRCLLLTCLIALSDVSLQCGAVGVIPGSHKSNLPHPYEGVNWEDIVPLKRLDLRPGDGVLMTESLSYGFGRSAGSNHMWLCYQYGPSYMLSFPGCEPTEQLLARSRSDPTAAHLLRAPYYHPEGAGKRKGKTNGD